MGRGAGGGVETARMKYCCTTVAFCVLNKATSTVCELYSKLSHEMPREGVAKCLLPLFFVPGELTGLPYTQY